MRRFEDADYAVLKEWFARRVMDCPEQRFFPKVGFIEPACAAGFLVQTDTPIAYIDFLISDPHSDSEDRASAIDRIVFALIQEARVLGFKVVEATSELPKVGRIANEFGFADLGLFHTYFREI